MVELIILTKGIAVGGVHEIESRVSGRTTKVKITKIISVKLNEYGTIVAEIVGKEVV